MSTQVTDKTEQPKVTERKAARPKQPAIKLAEPEAMFDWGRVQPTCITLHELEDAIVAILIEDKADPTQEAIEAIGNPVVAAGKLVHHPADKYGNGEWISASVLRRIEKAAQPSKEAEQAA